MRKDSTSRFRPAVEALEARRPLSAGLSGSTATQQAAVSASAAQPKPTIGYLVYRITNPNPFNDKLTPPFQQVLVQNKPPVPGQVYNILYVAVRNGSAKTFTAGDGLQVKFPGQSNATSILTEGRQWKPGGEIVFYVLTKKYYPLPNQVNSGFEFNLGGARSVAIPGPSGIFLRVRYRPSTFGRTLDAIVAKGPGAQGGKGIKTGIADTAIYEFVSSKTNRSDFGGYF